MFLTRPLEKRICRNLEHDQCICSEPFEDWTFRHQCDEKTSSDLGHLEEHYEGEYDIHHELYCKQCGKREIIYGSDG